MKSNKAYTSVNIIFILGLGHFHNRFTFAVGVSGGFIWINLGIKKSS